ncbi:MAG TPA: hypothetical protein H9694_10620 [Firmicutes bacterium]|nr:hypothetical protein [Bacillota bacterium]
MTSKKKIAVSAIAVGSAAVIALGGTFAWQSISQTALNEAMATINPGGRLHDDFNGQNKNVYVENFTSGEGATTIYARVRLDEYMEIGQGAGAAEGNEAVSVIGGAELDDKSTWTTRLPSGSTLVDEEGDAYWTWEMGGQGVYMPTFNKNKDSLQADINGTYDGLSDSDNIHYDDYVEYEVGNTKTDNAYYDADTNDADEGQGTGGGAGGAENVNYTAASEEHTAAMTGTATVITMQEWIEDYDMAPGAYWVWDTDGWAYWAQGIEPGQTTGLLLDEIIHANPPSDSWYYGINVVGQFVTADDIGFLNNTGFYDAEAGAAPTAAAEVLLETITGADIPNTTVTVTAQDNAATVAAGSTLQFTAAAIVDETGSPVDPPAAFTWKVTGGTEGTSITDGLLSVDAGEPADTELTITATYTEDGVPYVGTCKVTVTGAGA